MGRRAATILWIKSIAKTIGTVLLYVAVLAVCHLLLRFAPIVMYVIGGLLLLIFLAGTAVGFHEREREKKEGRDAHSNPTRPPEDA